MGGKVIVIISWVGGLFLVFLAGLLVYRASITYQLKQLETQKVSSKVAKKKLAYIKQRENEKHVRNLLVWGIGVTIFLFFLFSFTLLLQQKNDRLTSQLTQVNEEVLTLKTEQKQFLQQLPVIDYPETGIDFTNDKWETLLSTKDSRKIQGEMEQLMAQKLAPYIGLSTVILTVDRGMDKITLSIQNDEREALDMSSVTSKMVEDFTQVTELSEISFQTVGLVDGKMQKIGQWHYSRKDREPFILVSDENNQ